MTSYEWTGACTNISKQFSKDYLELRIKNIISNKVNYTLTEFYVPEDSNSNYVGTWNYDAYNQFRIHTISSCIFFNSTFFDMLQLLSNLCDMSFPNRHILMFSTFFFSNH